jgi:hypothetical protein
LNKMSKKNTEASQGEAGGLRKGLTSYGDSGFSLFARPSSRAPATRTARWTGR